MLFQINGDTNSISFPSAHALQPNGCIMNAKPYNDFTDKEITVNIYSKTGRPPSRPYVKRIEQIVATS